MANPCLRVFTIMLSTYRITPQFCRVLSRSSVDELTRVKLKKQSPWIEQGLCCYLLAAGGGGGRPGGGGGAIWRGAQPVFTTAYNPISSRNAVIFLFMVVVLCYNSYKLRIVFS